MEDDWLFPDGRTFSDIVGVPDNLGTDHLDDVASVAESWERIEGIEDEAEGASVCDSELNEVLKRSLNETESDVAFKRPAITNPVDQIRQKRSFEVIDNFLTNS